MRGVAVATVEVESIGIQPGIVFQAPGVEAGKNAEVEGAGEGSVAFDPGEEGFGGGGFVSVNSRREIDPWFFGCGFFGGDMEKWVAMDLGEGFHDEAGERRDGAPAFSKPGGIVALEMPGGGGFSRRF
jgi:hypothetical protein